VQHRLRQEKLTLQMSRNGDVPTLNESWRQASRVDNPQQSSCELQSRSRVGPILKCDLRFNEDQRRQSLVVDVRERRRFSAQPVTVLFDVADGGAKVGDGHTRKRSDRVGHVAGSVLFGSGRQPAELQLAPDQRGQLVGRCHRHRGRFPLVLATRVLEPPCLLGERLRIVVLPPLVAGQVTPVDDSQVPFHGLDEWQRARRSLLLSADADVGDHRGSDEHQRSVHGTSGIVGQVAQRASGCAGPSPVGRHSTRKGL
jgi:hypothetical protein